MCFLYTVLHVLNLQWVIGGPRVVWNDRYGRKHQKVIEVVKQVGNRVFALRESGRSGVNFVL